VFEIARDPRRVHLAERRQDVVHLVHCRLTRTPCRMPVSSTTSRRAALSANSPHSKLPVTDCQNPGGRRRSSSRKIRRVGVDHDQDRFRRR